MQKLGFSVSIIILLLFYAGVAHSQEQSCTDINNIFHDDSEILGFLCNRMHSVQEQTQADGQRGTYPYKTTPANNIIIGGSGWNRQLHLKTNVLGLGLAIANIAVEIDLAKHWSLTLPVYYSAWDYFKSQIKFRTLAFQPEFRYWPSASAASVCNDGFFTGAHFGLAYYNLATNGKYRYQDHLRKTPAIGGGVSVGYRLPIDKKNRLRMEFSVGAGVYSLHYDKFYNTPRTKDGLMIESVKKTYIGVDQATLSFSYAFKLKKKGGAR